MCPKRAPMQRPAAGADPAADERARVRRRVVGIDEAVRLQLLVELEHVDARADGHGAVHEVDLVDPVHQLDVDEDAAAQRDGAVGEAGAAGARDDRDPLAVGELDDLGDLLGGRREDDGVGHVLGPAVHREGRGHARAVEARGAAGEARARRRRSARSSVERRRRIAPRRSADLRRLEARRLGDELEQVDHVDVLLLALLRERPLRPRHSAETSVSTSSALARSTRRRLISAVRSGFSIGSPPPAPEQ